jgi:predicted transcriptional regulator
MKILINIDELTEEQAKNLLKEIIAQLDLKLKIALVQKDGNIFLEWRIWLSHEEDEAWKVL